LIPYWLFSQLPHLSPSIQTKTAPRAHLSDPSFCSQFFAALFSDTMFPWSVPSSELSAARRTSGCVGFFMIEMKLSVVSCATRGNLFFNSHVSMSAFFFSPVEDASDARYLTALPSPSLTATRTPASRSAERPRWVRSGESENG
jgi:hypothetical protein